MRDKNISEKYEFFVGLEIHMALKTKTKAFSPTANTFNEKANTIINEIDLGYPGTKPLVNKEMVRLAYYACKLLNMKIAKTIIFDRKNYFYPDLSKGYQITQFYYPLGENGYFEILKKDNDFKKIKINRIHMEEDTAKQIIKDNLIEFDFNRSGIPLIELVTDFTSFSSLDEVILFLEQLREEMLINEICSGDLYKGDFRIDLNVSIKKIEEKKYNNKVEIKNLNSFKNVKIAIVKEIKEQIMALEKNQLIEEVTKNFDEKTQNNLIMREKDQEYHYNFITETNILPITIGSDFLKEIESHKLFVLKEIKKNFIKNEIPKTQSKVILSSTILFQLYSYYVDKYTKKEDLKKIISFLATRFQEALKSNLSLKNLASDSITIRIQETLKSNDITYKNINKELLLYIIKLFYSGKINGIEIKDVLNKLLSNDKNIKKIISNFEKKEVISKEEIKSALIQFINENLNEYNKYATNKTKLEGFLIGRIINMLKNQADPRTIKEVVEKYIKNLD
ncbi:MAG: aspartyl/glutamyl-tRNA(Asn/Gln) amidotransferase subunit B [Candidatus Hepatoplasma vulgare]|nr:MAG: aspartyl/glutamyl-tRNA(Asn/Gln) amidotransferase subunit B [Candidatus Hepatoplasma sp.]